MKISFIFISVFVLFNLLIEQHSTKYLLVELEGNASGETPVDTGKLKRILTILSI